MRKMPRGGRRQDNNRHSVNVQNHVATASIGAGKPPPVAAAGPDPFSIFMHPPPTETPAERTKRLQLERWESTRNAEIEEMLRLERARGDWPLSQSTQHSNGGSGGGQSAVSVSHSVSSRTSGKKVRVLLVGQSESGKSTVLKNFQLSYAPQAFRAERITWTRIVLLNITHAVNSLICALVLELPPPAHTNPHSPVVSPYAQEIRLTDYHRQLAHRLKGVAELERKIMRILALPSDYEVFAGGNANDADEHHPHQMDEGTDTVGELHGPYPRPHKLGVFQKARRPQEFFVRGLRWRSPFSNSSSTNTAPSSTPAPTARPSSAKQPSKPSSKPSSAQGKHRFSFSLQSSTPTGPTSASSPPSTATAQTQTLKAVNTELLAEVGKYKDAIREVWRDEHVRSVLGLDAGARRPNGRGGARLSDEAERDAVDETDGKGKRMKVRLEDSAGFFLDNIDRILVPDYEPSDDDVVRARLRTMGVNEYPINLEKRHKGDITRDITREWIIYDVGGARCQRAAWIPYFEHMNAIIFLAPIDCFDERLVEDKRVNRLQDSYELYRVVISSKVLKKVQVILFLNKMDLLREKIGRGVLVNHYVSSFGDRPNTAESAAKYFEGKFRDMCRQFSPVARPFYSYVTSAVDIAATAVTLSIVRDGILRANLESADML